MITGHLRAQERLENSVAPVTLLLGPEHVGKKTLAAHKLGQWEVAVYDRLWVSTLTVDSASAVVRFAGTAPRGRLKYVVACLDTASVQSLNALLKALEEPPATVRFLLVSARPPLPTIASRSVILRCGLLTDTQVTAVLVSRGMDPEVAARQAPLGNGRVRPAMEAGISDPQAKARATAALRSAASGDFIALNRVMQSWDDESTELLLAWAWEAASDRWRIFESGVCALGRADGRNLLVLLSQHARAKPALAARAALTTLVAGKQRRP